MGMHGRTGSGTFAREVHQWAVQGKPTRRQRFFSVLLLVLPLVVVARMTIFVRQRTSSEYLQIDYAATIQILVVFTTLLAVLVAPKLIPLSRRMIQGSLGALGAYYVFAIASAGWSVAPTYTAYRALEVLVLSIAIFVGLSYQHSARQLEKHVLWAACMVVIFGVLMHIKFGGLSLEALHTNSYSAVAAMVFVYCLTEYMGSPQSSFGRRRLLRNAGVR